MPSERTPLRAVSTDASSFTFIEHADVERGARDDDANDAPRANANVEFDAGDSTPSASFRGWPRRKGYSIAFLWLAALVLCGGVLYSVEPESDETPASAAATPASASDETRRLNGAIERATAARGGGGSLTTTSQTSSYSSEFSAVANDGGEYEAPSSTTGGGASPTSVENGGSTESTSEESASSADGGDETSGGGGGSDEHIVIGWDEVLNPVVEEQETNMDGDEPLFELTLQPPPPAPARPPSPYSPPAPLSLATRHSYSNAEFAVGVVEACAQKHTASGCSSIANVYGCTWTGTSCRVDCGTFESRVGCESQGDFCAYNSTGVGGCTYSPYRCSALNDAASCTTNGGRCGWHGGACFEMREETERCAAKTKDECHASALNTTSDGNEVPCAWHVEHTVIIGGELTYTGTENVTNATVLPGTCVVGFECASFATPSQCAGRSPMCVYDTSAGACVRTARVAESHHLCAPLAPIGHRLCPNSDDGHETFCNFALDGAGFCQKCASLGVVDDCDHLTDPRGQARCKAKCFEETPSLSSSDDTSSSSSGRLVGSSDDE